MRSLCLTGVIVAAGAAWLSAEQAGIGQTAHDEAFVLLRNGSVLAGRVQRREEDYVVLREGATVHLEAYQVAKVGQSVSELYEFQRESLPVGKAPAHLQLAEWCLQHGLLDAASREVATAARLNADHPRLEFVRRRLAVASEAATLSSKEHPPDSKRPAAEDSIGSAPPVAVGASSAARPATRQEAAERKLALRELPDDAMETFRRRVQPLLLNSCTASGCHRGGGDESFVLDRRALWRDAPHTLTVQNLAETLKYVENDAPLESPLLRAAGSLHAPGLTSPPILPQSTSYGILEAWLMHITAADRSDEPPSEGEQPETVAEPSEPRQAVADPSDAELDAILSDFLNEEADGSIVERRIQRGVRATRKGKDDPFDPEEFNRRHSPRGGGR